MAEKVITRQMHCERCEKAGRPYRDNFFVVCGSNGFHIRKVDRYIPPEDKGFTPHLVAPYKLIDEKTIAISRVCCIDGCGLALDEKKEVFTYLKVTYEQLRLIDWNILVENKDLGYYL